MLRLKLSQIRSNPWNCNFLGPQEKASLRQLMKEDGPEKIQPVIVRKIASSMYELVDGEQRWRIACELGWETIYAIEREADDLQTKVLCVGYNRWRGRLDWFKLYDVIKKDVEAGVDVYKVYSQALTSREIESVLSLGNLVSKARKVLEQSLKKCPEITLEHLYLLSLFPTDQQESLVEKFRTPVVTQALLQTLNPFLDRSRASASVDEYNRCSFDDPKDPNVSTVVPGDVCRLLPGQSLSRKSDFFKEKDHVFNKQREVSKVSKQLDSTRTPTPVHLGSLGGGLGKGEDVSEAVLREVCFDCECGRHYRLNFKNMSVVVQKANELFEHVDMRPRLFQVYCGKCGSNHEFAVEGSEGEVKQVFCRRCRPFPREGILDVDSREVRWLG